MHRPLITPHGRTTTVTCELITDNSAYHARPRADTMPHVMSVLLRVLSAIQLTRLTIAFGAVSDIWFVILLTRGLPGGSDLPVATMPLAAALLAGAAVAIGLFAYGAALNDILDVRHDAAFSPERPIPAGRIRPGQAVVVTVGALIVAMLAAETFGTQALWIAMLTAAAALFFNVTGKFIPPVGIVVLGLMHAAHMLIPNYQLAFIWPVLLIMTHAMAIGLVVHVLEDKRPRAGGRAIGAVVAGWLFWSALLIGWAWSRSAADATPLGLDLLHPAGLLAPAAAVVGFIILIRRKTRTVSGKVAAEKVKRYGAMWQCLYAAAWLLALGMMAEALAFGILAVIGFVAMTLLKEINGLTGSPMTYRA